MPPKLRRSFSSFLTSITSGKPSMPLTNGYSIGVPMQRANAMNCASVRFWSRKKMTRCSRKVRRISSMTRVEMLFERSTPQISAPNAPDRRRTSTLLLDLDVRVADDRAVALLLAPHEVRHFLGRARDRIEPEREVALLQLARFQRLADVDGNAHQDV